MVAADEQPTQESVEQPAVGATATPEPPTTEGTESAPVTEEQAEVHIVQGGETLSGIAEQYGVTVKALRASNDLNSADVIVTGQELTIPTSDESTVDSSGDSSEDTKKDSSQDNTENDSKDSSSRSSSRCRWEHKVKKGEWVWQIARDYDVSPYKILEANNLTIKKAKIIRPGQVLCIP
jgi:LysM repeat protein